MTIKKHAYQKYINKKKTRKPNRLVLLLFIIVLIIALVGNRQVKTYFYSNVKEFSKLISSIQDKMKPKPLPVPVEYKKKPFNPMKYNYNANYDNYIPLLKKTSMTLDKATTYSRYFKMPVKYWPETKNKDEATQISVAIQEFSKYFDIIQSKNKRDANLIIYVVADDRLKDVCKNLDSNETLGCGGGYFRVQQKNSNLTRFYDGYVYLKESVFQTPLPQTTILHELGHAFGISGHSSSNKDIMFAKVETINYYGITYSVAGLDKLSPGDLNTLYLIYNGYHKD